MSNDYELRKTDHGHTQLKNGAGQWTSPVIVDDRDFYKSGVEAAEKLKCAPVTVANALREDREVRGHKVRRPTRAEIKKAMSKPRPSPDSIVFRVGAGGRIEVRGNAGPWSRAIVVGDYFYASVAEAAREGGMSRDTLCRYAEDEDVKDVSFATLEDVPEDAVRIYTEDKPAETPGADEPFIGFRWPDGRVDVRLASGGDILFTRNDAKELPPEVISKCRWI